MQQKINLSELYTICDYIKVPEDSKICPVLLEVKQDFDSGHVNRDPKQEQKSSIRSKYLL